MLAIDIGVSIRLINMVQHLHSFNSEIWLYYYIIFIYTITHLYYTFYIIHLYNYCMGLHLFSVYKYFLGNIAFFWLLLLINWSFGVADGTVGLEKWLLFAARSNLIYIHYIILEISYQLICTCLPGISSDYKIGHFLGCSAIHTIPYYGYKNAFLVTLLGVNSWY